LTPASAIIVGGGLGGLSAAIHLRLQNRAVTLFEANDRVGGRASVIERDGYRFDTGPSLLNYPWVFEELFAAAGRRFADYVDLIPVDPSVEFRWPDGTTFSLSSDLKNLREECERLEPGCAPRLIAWMRDAAFKFDTAFGKLVTRNEDNPLKWLGRLNARELLSMGIWRSLDSELGRFFKNRYIREAFGSYGMYLGGSPFELPGLFSILAYGELAYGLWLPRGGIYGLVCGMQRLARELGVQIHTSTRVRSIDSQSGAVTGVRLESGEFFPAQVVVSNVDVPTTERSLLANPPRKPSDSRMTPGVLTFYWGLNGKQGDYGHHTIFLPQRFRHAFDQLKQGQIPEDLPFYISIASASDPSLAPEDGSSMFVLVPTPVLSAMPNANWLDIVPDVKARVLSRIGLDSARIDVEEVWTPVEWQRRFGLYDGSAFGAAHSLFQMGPFRSRNYSTEIRGLYYAGASTTPGTGMPMVVLGGRMVAERIAASEQNVY
jgi:phytoene desaturase